MRPVRGPLSPGERVLAVDGKDRRYLLRLTPGGTFGSHDGVLHHDDVIGQPDGTWVQARRREGSDRAERSYLVLRPTLADLVIKMPRGAQVIYPKDLAAMLMEADVFPGARVLEAGVGSGALSMALLRAGALVTGYELRPDFANRARNNVRDALGPDAAFDVHERDVYEGIDERELDRILLDLPEPWRVLPHARLALCSGGILTCYLPTINQSAELRAALQAQGFVLATTSEVLRRTWHVEGRSVRPDHRMVAHTGFLTTARLADGRPPGRHGALEPGWGWRVSPPAEEAAAEEPGREGEGELPGDGGGDPGAGALEARCDDADQLEQGGDG